MLESVQVGVNRIAAADRSLPSLSPCELLVKKFLTGNFFREVSSFRRRVKEGGFSSAFGGPSRGALIVVCSKRPRGDMDTWAAAARCGRSGWREHSTAERTTTYAQKKYREKNIAPISRRKDWHLTTTQLNARCDVNSPLTLAAGVLPAPRPPHYLFASSLLVRSVHGCSAPWSFIFM